jgi:membrane fusion protein (multidrug efflux system)
MIKKICVIISVLLFISIGCLLVFRSFAGVADKDETVDFFYNEVEPLLPVTIEEVRLMPFPLTVTARGSILPGEERVLYVPFSGQVLEVLVVPGEQVKKGDLLFKLDTREIEGDLIAAKDELLLAQKSLAGKLAMDPGIQNNSTPEIVELKSKLSETERKYKNGQISYETFLENHTTISIQIINRGGFRKDLQEIESGIRSALAKVIRCETLLENGEIKSPINGAVSFNGIHPGTVLREGDHLCTILHFTSSRASLTVLEKDIQKIRTGQSAAIAIGVNQEIIIPAAVESTIPEKDMAAGGYTVNLRFNPGTTPVFKGMFAQGIITVDTLDERIIIPSNAVLREGERYYVFVITDGLAWWRWVEIGLKNGDYLEVIPAPFNGGPGTERTTGIDPGELIAVEGHTLLTHKAKVSINE